MKPVNQEGKELIENSKKEYTENLEIAKKLVINARDLLSKCASSSYLVVSGQKIKVLNELEDGQRYTELQRLHEVLYGVYCDLIKLN